MSSTVKIGATISNTDPSCQLGLEIWVDNQKLVDFDHLLVCYEFVHELEDVPADHELAFILKNKTEKHTKIDQQGNLIQDACLVISNLNFDNTALGYAATENSDYTHDFNGSKLQSQEKFYGVMGCNGRVNLKFSTPMYRWLLANI
jgi:hypothetical protein